MNKLVDATPEQAVEAVRAELAKPAVSYARLAAAAAALGQAGGKAGRGASKRRGDSAYYKALRAKHASTPKPPGSFDPQA